MDLRKAFLSSGLVLIVLWGAGCQKPVEPVPQADIQKNYDNPLPPGAFALRKLDPSQYPDFSEAWTRAKGTELRRAVLYSIDYLRKSSSKKYYPVGPITHEQTLKSLEAFLKLLDRADTPATLNQLIRDNFDVYMSIGCDNEGTVLFTGYYSPIFDGSQQQSDQFKYPLYRLPADLKKDEEGNPVGGPWRTREEIEKGGLLAGNEIAWVGDPFEAYVITVQGSGFLKLPDGNLYEIGYAGHNGHEYTPIRKMMVADGVLDRYKINLDSMIRYFKDNPGALEKYMYQNKRYVFFRESKGGPFGCLNEPVTRYHTIATDKEIFPRGGLTFLDTMVPDDSTRGVRHFRNFSLDQDRGAAIRAPGRCDIYMGIGEQAGKMAGYTFYEGKLYYLVVRDGTPLSQEVAPSSTPPTPNGQVAQ